MAIDDIESLQEDGYTVSPSDIIRLNAFGLKVEKNTESSISFILPRVSILGDLVFRQPTIGSEIWMDEVSRIFNLSDITTFIQIRAYSLSVDQKELVDSSSKDSIQKAIVDLFAKLKPYTMTQLVNAIDYVTNGNNHSDGELPPESQKGNNADDIDDENYSFSVGVMKNGLVLGLGSYAEIKNMTKSELLELVKCKTNMAYGLQTKKDDEAKLLGQYYKILDEIKGKKK